MREAEEFYHTEAKHLSIKNDRDRSRKHVSSDQKYDKKRNLFEQKMLEFYSFTHELTEGPREEELLLCFVGFAQRCFEHIRTANEVVHQRGLELNEIMGYLKNQADVVVEQRKLIEEKQRHLGELISASESAISSSKSENSRNFVSLMRSKSSAIRDKLTNRMVGVRDLGSFNAEQASSAGRHKEGILYSPNRHRTPNLESSWQSNWCVISKGQFSEIVNWKKKPDAHKASISLKLASVRQLPDSERRFCFELVTLQGSRVYQALSNEDMIDWMNVLKNAIESQLNGTGSSPDLRSLAIPGDDTVAARRSEDFSDDYVESSLITAFRTDPSNRYCADCGSKGPEWCSINLGILLCIECSGVHRSLGTHISKIRSLTLDNSFTPDLIDMVRSVGNRMANSIWEAVLTVKKPVNSDSRDVKAAFIRAKYVERRF
ncbi:ArfGap-domain-containing protein, partial [Basidiobolus meristosporus CBS 931.73]